MINKTGVSVILVFLCAACLFIPRESSFGQIQTSAVPFLRISTSPEANGQGSTSIARMTDDNYSIITNPAFAGLLSLQNDVSMSFYPAKTNWLPSLGLKDLTINTYILNAGINIKEYFGFPLSLGVAYSRFNLNLGSFYRTSSYNPEVGGPFDAEEHADAMSIGAGADVGIKVALGITFRRITSNLATPGTEYGSASAWSRDYGLLINVPIINLVADNVEILPQLTPVCDISFGSALSNVGGKMIYGDRAQADPLPRSIALGTSLEVGLTYMKPDYKILSLVWSREAANLLVDGSDYRDLFGDLDFIKNVVRGEWTDQVEVSQGWEMSLGEFLFVRGGSFEGNGYSNIRTTGFGISTTGIFRMLQFRMEKSNLIASIADHIALRYNQSEYKTSEQGHPLNGTKFSSLSLLVKL